MKSTGFTLVVTLIFLLIMTMLGLSMFSGFTLDQTMAGNHREKSRAFDAAQTALSYAEYWLVQPSNATLGVLCSSSSGMSSTPQICTNNLLTSPTTLPWGVGTNYTPAGMSLLSTDIGFYAAQPTLYIQNVGATTAGKYYLLTTAAQGGNDSAVAVLQSVYLVSVQTSDLGNP